MEHLHRGNSLFAMNQPKQLDTRYPDYRGGSIVNLMASLIRARGGSADYADLELLPARPSQMCNTFCCWWWTGSARIGSGNMLLTAC